MQGDGDWLRKGGFFIAEVRRDRIENPGWQGDALGKAAMAAVVTWGDAEYFAIAAKVHIAAFALGALATVFGRVKGDAVTKLPIGDAFANGDDFPRCLVPHDDGHLAAATTTIHAVDVAAADAAGFDIDKHFAGAGCGLWEIEVVVKLARGGEDEGAHGGWGKRFLEAGRAQLCSAYDECLLPCGADAEEADASSSEFCEAIQVGFGESGQVLVTSDAADVCDPALVLFVNGFTEGEVFAGGRWVLDDLVAELVGGADFDGIQSVEAVEVGDGEFVSPIDHHGVADEDHVQPAAAAGTAGGGTEFAPHVVKHVADVFVFSDKGAGPDAGGVGFADGDDAVDLPRWNAGTCAGTARSGVGRGNKRVGPVIDIEVGALCAFEKQALARFHRFVEGDGGVGDVWGEDFGGFQDAGDRRVCIDGVDACGGERLIVEGDAVAEFGFEDVWLGQQDGAQSTALHLVRVGWANAASGGADLFVTTAGLTCDVEGAVVGHDEVGGLADQEVGGLNGDALAAQLIDLFDETEWVHDNAIADDAELPWPEDPAGDQVQYIFIAPADDGVSGIITASSTHDDVGTFGEVIDDFAFSFIAPLGAYDNGIGHDL